MDCKLCQRNQVDQAGASTAVCLDCRKKLGIVPMPVAKRTAPCARCNGMRFVRSIPRELTATGSDYVYGQAAPMAVTIVPTVSKPLLRSGMNVDDADVNKGAGQFELYICAGCGFCDWYVTNPQDIPIGPEYMTDVVDLASRDAYR